MAAASTFPEFAQKFRAEELAAGRVRALSAVTGLLGCGDAWTRRAAVAARSRSRRRYRDGLPTCWSKPTKTCLPANCWFASMTRKRWRGVAEADAQVALHKRARNDQSTPAASADRRKAEDAVADSERSRRRCAIRAGQSHCRTGGPAAHRKADLDAARAALSRAQDRLREQQDALAKLEGIARHAVADTSGGRAQRGPGRMDAGAGGARKDTNPRADRRRRLAGRCQERRIGGADIGAGNAGLGDVSALRVRAEVDEQYLGRMRVGQSVEVRAAAFRGREFDGKVSSIARIVGPGRINSGDPRKFNDVDVLEVVVDLPDPGPLVVGEQVDVYFKTDQAETE